MPVNSVRLAVIATAMGLFGAQPSFADPVQTNVRSTSTRMVLGTQDPATVQGRFGYLLMDASTGEVLAGRNADDLFIPASLSKIPTTLVTLSALGGERRFETTVLADGDIVDGIVQGDLHLVGSGDPSLRTADLLDVATQLSQAGIGGITGRFVYHAEAIPTVREIDEMQPDGRLYNPGVSGLNLNENVNRRRGSASPVSRPAHYTASALRVLAGTRGIILPAPVRAERSAVGLTVATHLSKPADEIAAQMMQRSINMTAEALGAASAQALGSTPHTLADAAETTTDWLKTEVGPIGGTGWAGFDLANHSGLSTRSRATPRQIAAILRQGYLTFGETFVALHSRAKTGGYRGFDLHGKIGSMRFVRGYGGFLRIGGRDLIFAIMANDDTRRALADGGKTGLRSKLWARRALRRERGLLSGWIEDHWQRVASR